MPKQCHILFLIGFFGFFCNAQTVTGCDFFPNQNEVTYTYIKTILKDKSKIEFKYIYQGNVMIEGKSYKSFNVFVNGSVPETNQVLYVKCESNGLVMGNGIYAFNRQVIGYSQEYTKIVDVNATPIFEVGMVHTGDFYLPSVIKPNNAIGETWIDTNYMHGTQVSVKRTIMNKNLTMEVQGKDYENVYHIRKETLIEGVVFSNEYSSVEDVYFAKGIGMIKTVLILDSENQIVTELDNGLFDKNHLEEQTRILEEIKDIIKKLPADSEYDTTYHDLVENKSLSTDQLMGVRNQLNDLLQRYQFYVNDSIRKQNKQIATSNEKIDTYNQLESNLKKEGIIDQRLLGTWKLMSTGKSFYKFYEDGMLEIFKDSPEPKNITWQKHLFRITKGNTLEELYKLYQSDDFGHQKYHIDFDIDKKSGKPLIHLKLVYLNSVESKPERIQEQYYNNKIITYIKLD